MNTQVRQSPVAALALLSLALSGCQAPWAPSTPSALPPDTAIVVMLSTTDDSATGDQATGQLDLLDTHGSRRGVLPSVGVGINTKVITGAGFVSVASAAKTTTLSDQGLQETSVGSVHSGGYSWLDPATGDPGFAFNEGADESGYRWHVRVGSTETVLHTFIHQVASCPSGEVLVEGSVPGTVYPMRQSVLRLRSLSGKITPLSGSALAPLPTFVAAACDASPTGERLATIVGPDDEPSDPFAVAVIDRGSGRRRDARLVPPTGTNPSALLPATGRSQMIEGQNLVWLGSTGIVWKAPLAGGG